MGRFLFLTHKHYICCINFKFLHMKKGMILGIITILFLLGSCRTKKETIEKEKEYVYIHDTVTKDREVIKTEKITDTLTIELPCGDKGVLKDFSRKIKTSAGYVFVYSKNGKINAEMHLDATVNSKEENKNIKFKYIYKDKENKVYVTKCIERWWLWTWFIASLFYIIYRIVNFFRKRNLI